MINIIEQLCNDIDDYNTYYYCEAILISLKNVRPEQENNKPLDNLCKENIIMMEKTLSLKYVYRLQTLKVVYDNQLLRNVKLLACIMCIEFIALMLLTCELSVFVTY